MNEIEKAIDYFETQKQLFPNSFNVLSGHYDTALESLLEKQERENPQPLTLEQLKSMDLLEWCWIEVLVPFDFELKVSAYYQKQEVGTERTMLKTFWCGYPGMTFGFDYCNYGKTWLAYAHKPEQEEK